MNALRFSLVICLLALLSANANNADMPSPGGSPAPEDRVLVVTFIDRSINQKLPDNPADEYRTPGQYSNSEWSEHLAQELADRHHIQLVAQWPVTTLGVSCVIYEVPEPLELQQVMADLQNDREVSLVQRMQNFLILSGPSLAG